MTSENRQLSQLPEGWVWTRLGEICFDPQYGWTTSAAVNGSLHLLRTTDITAGDIDWDSVPFCKQEPPDKQKYLLKDGDIVISRAGSVGYSLLVRTPRETIFASYLIRFRPLIDEVYLAYFLKSPSYWESISEKSLGIAIPNVNASKLKQVTVPLSPLPEQHRIAAKIEELFTKRDAGVEALKQVKAKLSRYRQAVLKHAFEGKLTEEWREAHKGQTEPASVLLEKIKAERAEIGKYKELSPMDASSLPELPEVWTWARVGDLYDIIGGGTPSTSRPEYWDGDIPWITSADIYGVKEIRPRKTITRAGIENSATNLVPAGSLIVVTRVGLGKIAITGSPLCFSQDSQALIGNNSLINPVYSLYYLSKEVQRFKYEHRGTTIAGVTKKQLAELTFTLPPLAEQHKIVSEIERCFSVADAIEKVVGQSLKQAERLRQSILKRAFEGKLVPQDPTDEPAEELLKRIKMEKAKRQATASKT